MKNVMLEMLFEKNIKSDIKEIKELELKIIREKRREEIIKGKAHQIKMNNNKNGFLYDKNIVRKDLDYKGNKVNIKKYYKNNIKKNKINIKKNTYIIIMIFFNLIISNNNNIEYKFSNITLKIRLYIYKWNSKFNNYL